MDILTCMKARLGFPASWNWRQDSISVPYWRLYWNDSRGSFVKDSNHEIELGPDKVVAIPPYTVYSTRAERGTIHFYIHFSIEPPYSEMKPGLMVFKDEKLISLAKRLASESSFSSALSHKTRLKAQIFICEALLLVPDSKLPPKRKLTPCIEAAVETLKHKPGVSNSELIAASCMSRSTFLSLFRRETGMSPQKLSAQIRLEESCMKLHFGAKSIKEIAEEAGFCDRYHFSKAFKRAYGCGPAHFRRQLDDLKR